MTHRSMETIHVIFLMSVSVGVVCYVAQTIQHTCLTTYCLLAAFSSLYVSPILLLEFAETSK